MAARKKKRHWNVDLRTPGLGSRPETPPPSPLPGQVPVGHSTPGGPPEQWECLRCERLKLGKNVEGLDHTPRCPWRGKGDPGVA